MGEGVSRLAVGLERANPGGWVFGLEHRPDDGAALPALLLQTPVDRLRARLEAYDETALLHDATVLLVHRQPAACRDHLALSRGGLDEALPFQLSEEGLSAFGKHFGDRLAGPLDDEIVGVDELPAQTAGRRPADRGLA